MLGGCQFFHDVGVTSAEDLIAVSYDLAWYWKVDPEEMMSRSLDLIIESQDQALRINAYRQDQ